MSVCGIASPVGFVVEGEVQEIVYRWPFLATTAVLEIENISISCSRFQVGCNEIFFTSDVFSNYVEVKMSKIESKFE